MQIERSLRCIMLDNLCCLHGGTVFIVFRKGTILEKGIFYIKCVFWLYLQLLFQLLRSGRIQPDFMNVLTCSCEVPDILTESECT
jgi:hypothetical protein